ncbi:MAG: RsmB/NOP family class I SAM-dependent RNA methyltransferase [Pseudomonadota bacterium]
MGLAVEGLPARRAAFWSLKACFQDGASLDEAFAKQRGDLSGPDAGLAWGICQQVARERLRLKRLKRAFIKRSLPKKAADAHIILDIALVELLFLNVAPHAAISIAVEQAKTHRVPAVKAVSGLINAVLRNVMRRKTSGKFHLPPPQHALPEWLQKRFKGRYGEGGAEAIARLYLTEPSLHLSARDAAAKEALEAVPDFRQDGQSALFPPGTPPTGLPGFAEGGYWVQDRAAALPAQVLAPEAGALCYDLCAAPGGKTLQLAAMGAQVHSVDISAARLERLAQNLERTGLSADIEAADLITWLPPVAAGSVLLDAPCTALGTLRRHPDVVHHRSEKDFATITHTQAALLEKAWSALAPEGHLVYAVCSLEPEEGCGIIDAFLQAHDDAETVSLKPADYALPSGCADGHGALITPPHLFEEIGGVDGFFIAKLRRTR